MRLPIALAASAMAIGMAVPTATAEGEVVAVIADAPAAHHRVVLVGMPATARAAIARALDPWSIAVSAGEEAMPADDATAAAIARRHEASAVAWIDGGGILHVYDDLRRETEHRAVPPPEDDESAAALGLTLKTILRRPMPVVTALAEPPPPAPVEVDEVVLVPVERAPERRFVTHVSASIGAGVPVAASAPTMTRIGGRLSLELPALPGVGFGLGVVAGPSAPVDSSELERGSYRDIAVGAIAEWRTALGRHLWLVPAAGASVHLTRLEGVRVNPQGMEHDLDERATLLGLDLEVAVETGGRLRGGAVVGASVTTTPDPYEVRGQTVLDVPTATVSLALRMSFQ